MFASLCVSGSNVCVKVRGGELFAVRRIRGFGSSSSKPLVGTGLERGGEQTLGPPTGVRAPVIPVP